MPASLLPSTPVQPTNLADALARIAALEEREVLAQGLAAAAAAQSHILLSHLHEGLLLLDATGRVALLNDEYCRQLGLALPAAQWLGLSGMALAEEVKNQFSDPAGFVSGSVVVWQRQAAENGTPLAMADGRVLERDALPVAYGASTGFLVSYRDVTARHQAAQALREVSRVPEENPSPVLRLNAAGDRLYANAAARRLQSQLPYAVHAALVTALQNAALDALRHQQRQRLTLAAGQLWFQVEVVPVVAEGYINLYLNDITALREAEEQLIAEQAFIQQVLDTAPSMIYVRDRAGGYVFQNRALVVLAAEAQLSANAAPGSARADDLAHFAAVDAQVLAQNAEVVVEERLTMPDGSVRWFQSVKRPLHQPDGTTHVLGVSSDITDAKLAQLTLARSEKQYRNLMEYAQALICTYDLAGTTLSVNPALAALLGQSVEELLGQPVAASLLAEEQNNFGLYLAHIAEVGEAEGVLRVQPRGHAEVRHLLYHNFVVREPGQAPYIISHSHDITARVESEQATQRARQAAEAAATARQNFLANMSHEIRTPMNGVLGMAAQLAKTALDPRQHQLVDIMQRSGQHLLAVLNDVLDMAKISSGQVEFAQVPFNLCDSVAAVIQPLVLQATEKGLAFEAKPLRASCAYPWVIGDAHRLNQILVNLVGNAIKFTEKGTIAVVGELMSEDDTSLTVCFRVSDTGIGIAPAQQARIFESFTQAYADTSRQFGGTGLGLSISRALVEQLGGHLTLESEPGQGSTFAFTLTLPKAAAPAAVATPAARYDTGQLAGKRVLLVEDNEINRVMARMMLEPWGVVLDEAIDGPAGLACLEAARYDVVLMDIQLPGLSGVTVTQRLRQLPDPARAATPVLALTANAFREDVDQYLAAGLNDYLAKPFEEEALYAKMVALLAAPPLYDLTLLRRQAQGRPAFVDQILRSFLTNMPASLARLGAAAAAARWPEAAEVAHHIKPNLLALGIVGIGPAMAVLEQAHRAAPGAAPAPEALSAAATELIALVEKALAALGNEPALV